MGKVCQLLNKLSLLGQKKKKKNKKQKSNNKKTVEDERDNVPEKGNLNKSSWPPHMCRLHHVLP